MSTRGQVFGRLVWAPDLENGFILCKLRDIGTETMSVEPLHGGSIISAQYDEIFPAEEDLKKDVEDNCALMYLNEGTLLNNCRLRYARKQIYTYVANILISINPYEQISDLYSSATIEKYRGKSIGTLPPHIFAIGNITADSAYRDMKRTRQSQSIIVSGESGAGKTESQKCILRYLCESWGSTAGPIEQRILETNPILEAFGNAKTLRNNNSSRFGKFVEIHFNSKHSVGGGFISHYLLEKSRICRQLEDERNYHIFYQLIAGADEHMAKRLHLRPTNTFKYLKHGCTQFFTGPSTAGKILKDRREAQVADLHDELVDDFADFHRLLKALHSIGFNTQELNAIFDVVAAVLHLGDVHFAENVEDTKGGCIIEPCNEVSLQTAAVLLGLDEYELKNGLTSRVMQPTKGGDKGTIIRVPLKPHEASAARDALAKDIYSRLFDSIVARINKCIPFSNSISYIGVLDIAGFEFFKMNSFEQFCINYCNEKLQNFFNDRILKQEQEMYAKEGLGVPHIDYTDNKDCIDLFERKIDGLLDLLDEEARLPRPSPQHFTSAAHKQLKDHFRLTTPRKSKLREHREIRDDEGLLIRHFAGSVCYQTSLFLQKNNDALHTSLEMLLESSNSAFVRNLFAMDNEKSQKELRKKTFSNKLAHASVSNKFRSQLGELIKKLQLTNTNFVRCIKPNSEMKSNKFEGAMILSQLKCAGMASVLKLMQQGYPSRTSFADLYKMYEKILPSRLARLDPRLFCKCLFHALGLNDKDFKFGQTKVFFKPGKFAEFDQMLRQDPTHMEHLVKKVQSWLLHVRWKKAQYGVLSCIKLKNKILWRAGELIKIQSALRGYLTRKNQHPRLHLYHETNMLLKRVTELNKILKSLSTNSQVGWSSAIKGIVRETEQLLVKIKKSDRAKMENLATENGMISSKVDSTLASLREQLAIDEAEKVKKIEEEKRRMEEEKEREKSDAEEKLRQERAKRVEMAENRKREQEENREEQEVLQMQQARMEALNRQRDERLKQEKLDSEIARRLAQEDHSLHMLEADNLNSVKGMNVSNGSKYDLTGFKYVELRDIINTSTDTALLLACKEEFHRRLQIYQQWKNRNQSRQNNDNTCRLPMALLAASSRSFAPNIQRNDTNIQRYFKVPFAKPAHGHMDMCDISKVATSYGMWYAHFDGQWIARQMELHPNKRPLLLVAGRDDLEMCELSLDATQLTRKKGAEISAVEFEQLWHQCGGPSYHLRSNFQKY